MSITDVDVPRPVDFILKPIISFVSQPEIDFNHILLRLCIHSPYLVPSIGTGTLINHLRVVVVTGRVTDDSCGTNRSIVIGDNIHVVNVEGPPFTRTVRTGNGVREKGHLLSFPLPNRLPILSVVATTHKTSY